MPTAIAQSVQAPFDVKKYNRNAKTGDLIVTFTEFKTTFIEELIAYAVSPKGDLNYSKLAEFLSKKGSIGKEKVESINKVYNEGQFSTLAETLQYMEGSQRSVHEGAPDKQGTRPGVPYTHNDFYAHLAESFYTIGSRELIFQEEKSKRNYNPNSWPTNYDARKAWLKRHGIPVAKFNTIFNQTS